MEDRVVLTTLPIVADLVGAVSVRRWVYYCVDDFSCWPGLDGHTLGELERLLADRVDRVVAAGENLAERLRAMGREPTVITHGIDLQHWMVSAEDRTDVAPLASLPRPRVLFWGLIDRRLDVGWLQSLRNAIPSASIVLVGPEQNPDPALQNVPRLHRVGPLTLGQLPIAAANADVLIMPYADLPVTRVMQPLKLKEYMATGKPVVARCLPAVEDWQDCLDAAGDEQQFVQAVQHRIETGVPTTQLAARRRLAKETWADKAQSLRAVLFDD
jgi:glycosyltransferase involved in cell wall biosynthesis